MISAVSSMDLANKIFAALVALMAAHRLWQALQWLIHAREVTALKDAPLPRTVHFPSVAIVFSAKNEQDQMGAAVFTFLHQEYPDLKVVGVNDRSTDRTGAILHHYALEEKNFSLVQVEKLPSHWLGKNHALWLGAQEAGKVDWLLFTDADVKFHPETVARAIGYAQIHQLDHLVAIPEIELRGPWESALYVAFTDLFHIQVKPWRVRQAHTRDAMGIGAFNMIRRTAYEKIGTHEAFRMDVVDDMRLGILAKNHGFKQDVVYGRGCVRLRWQKNFPEMIRGLEKNMFPGMRFSKLILALSLGMILCLGGVLIAGLFHPHPLVRVWAAAGLFFQAVAFGVSRKVHQASWPLFFILPLGYLFAFITLARSAYLTFRRGGVMWRDTFYPIKAFKKPKWGEVFGMLAGRW